MVSHYHPCDLDCPNGLTAGRVAEFDRDPCGHCGATDVGSYAAGSAGMVVDGIYTPMCHPNATGRPDCYRLVTVYKHPMPCSSCTPTPEGDHRVLIDVIEIAPDGTTHTYWSTHCRHGDHVACSATELLGLEMVEGGFRPRIGRKPAQCKTCASPCICSCHKSSTKEEGDRG